MNNIDMGSVGHVLTVGFSSAFLGGFVIKTDVQPLNSNRDWPPIFVSPGRP